MKEIYVGRLRSGNYLFSESDLHDPSRRVSFASEKDLISYLNKPEMKKLRGRRNLVVKSSLDDNSWLERGMKKVGFKCVNIESLD